MKKVSILMLFLLLLSFHAVQAQESGTCGMNVTWTVEGDAISFTKTAPSIPATWGEDCKNFYGYSYTPVVEIISKLVIKDKIILPDGIGIYVGYPIREADLSNFDTSGITNMSSIFLHGSETLRSLDVSNWDTSNVTDMSGMFSSLENLTSLDVSNWDTSNVTDMSNMFSGLSYLSSLDISNWDTSNVTTMSNMFAGCESLTSLNLNSWSTSNVTTMDRMFLDCFRLTSLDLSNWDTSNVTTMIAMFHRCGSLTSLNLNSWSTSNVTTMGGMFSDCSSLTSLDLSNWKTSNVTTMNEMFFSCEKLTSLNLNSWDTSNVTDMGSLFNECYSLTSLNLNSWNTSNVTTMDSMFSNCFSLTSLDLSNWKTSNVTTMNYMFSGCSGLTSLNLGNWNSSNVINFAGMFSGCNQLTTLELGSNTLRKNIFTTLPYYDSVWFYKEPGSAASAPLDIWSTERGGELFSKYDGYTMSGKWVTNIAYHILRFDANSGTGSMDAQYIPVNESVPIVLNTFTRDGYSFSGWNTQPDGSGTAYGNREKISLDADTTLYAQWNNYVTVRFDANFGAGIMDPQAVPASTAAPLNPNAFTREGFIFTGWNTKADGSGTSYADGAEITISADLILYAQWKENGDETLYVTVSFDANGGTGIMNPMDIAVNQARTLTTNTFTREGFTFIGWNTKVDGSGTSYADGAEITISADLILYAQWKENSDETLYVTVSFDANGGTGTMNPMDIAVNQARTLTANTFTREGFTFTGWNTKADGSGTSYADGAEITISADLILYAQWKENGGETVYVTVKFEANGGSGSMKAMDVPAGSPFTLKANTFTREDFVFTGWNTKADGTGTSYADGAEISISEDLILYAQWEENKSEIKVSVILKNIKDDGSKKAPNDLKDDEKFGFNIVLVHGDKKYTSERQIFAMKDIKGIYEIPFEAIFKEKLPAILNEVEPELKDLPKFVLGYGEPVYGLDEESHRYYLEAVSWINSDGVIEIQLVWKDERNTSQENEENFVHILPEDEIGAYALRKDGTKEYLIFQTYDICMAYLGSDELCSGYQRCYHK